jgi:hypothetical protein
MAQSRKRRQTSSTRTTSREPFIIDLDSKGNKYAGSPDVITTLRQIEAQLREDLGGVISMWDLQDFLPHSIPLIMDKIRESFANDTLYSEEGLDSMIQNCIPVAISRTSGQKFTVIYTSGAICLMRLSAE